MAYIPDKNSELAFSTFATLASGATYDSGILDLGEWTQVETDVLSDVDGTITINFIRDAAGTDILRTLVVPYTGGEGYRTFAAPAFTPYVQYQFTCNESGQTDFYFDTKFLKVPLSPQILGADAFISPKMVTQLNRSVIVGRTSGGESYSNVDIDSDNNLKVAIQSPRTGFGEINTAVNRPKIQGTGTYGFLPKTFNPFTAGTGSAGIEDRMFKTSTGAGVGGYGAIQSDRALNYKAGESGLARFTARFDASAANSWQGVGLVNLGDELSFGYNGEDFGIWHRYGGIAECRVLEVTIAAAGTETAGLTLNDTLYNFPVTAGSLQHNAFEIASAINSTIAGWNADQLDASVIISAASDGAKSNTYNLSSTGDLSGTFDTLLSGVTKTSDFTTQANWNVDKCNGAGGSNNKSGFTLDHTKGNIYQITYQYLGFGNIVFSVERPESGFFIPVHRIKYAGANTSPSLGNPSLRLGSYCVSLGSTTNLDVYVGSFAGFVQGEIGRTANPRAVANTQNITTAFENVITLRNRRTYNGRINQIEVIPDFIEIASESSKTVVAEVRLLAGAASGEVNFQLEDSVENDTVVDIDTTSIEHTEGVIITEAVVPANGVVTLDLTARDIRIEPGNQLIIQAKTTGGAAADCSVAVGYYEDL